MQLSSIQKGWLARIGFLAIALLFCSVYYSEIIHRLPFGIHDWAQADRLSLAINFYDHGMNFFLPATHNLYSKGGVVGVEFPLQAYIAGGLGHIFGRECITVSFRILDILIAVSGLYALFLILFNRTRDFIFSLFTPLFIFCSPVYVYYSGNFMPDAASVSICFIGFYFFFRYLDDGHLRSLFYCLLILTLAALIKTTSITYLGGITVFALWQMLRTKSWKTLWQTILFAAAMLVLILANLGYMKYLDAHYKSDLFLAQTNPFKSWEHFHSFLEHEFKERWMQEYLLPQQYLIFILIVVMGLVFSFRLKDNRRLILPILVFLIGVCTLTGLLGSQLQGHDYYILPLVFPLLGFLLVIAVLAIRQNIQQAQLLPVRAGFAAAIIFTFFFADHQVYQRHQLLGIYNEQGYSFRWLEGGNRLLDSIGVTRQTEIMLADNPPNLGLIYCDRKGYNVADRFFKSDVNYIGDVMNDRHINILVANAGTYYYLRQEDSTKFIRFTLLGVKDDLAVLKLHSK